MKALIWIGGIFILAIIFALMSSAGIFLGGIPMGGIFVGGIFLIKKLCKKVDESKENKEDK